MRKKFLFILECFLVLVLLIGCTTKERVVKEEENLTEDTELLAIIETEQTEINFSSETKSDILTDNIATKTSTNIESSDIEIINTETENRKPVENTKPDKNTTNSESALNSNTNLNSKTEEEQLPGATEEEIPIIPQISKEAFELINAERLKLGLEPAVWDVECERIALQRGDEIAPYAIPEHDGFFKFQNENRKLCECLAWGYTTAEGVVNGWMNSAAHKDILMDPDYIKLAVVKVGNKWVAVNSR